MAAKASPCPYYRIVSVVGTRPEAIKMGPVVRALSALPFLEQEILLTGQHRGLASHFGGVRLAELRLDLTEHSAGEICEVLHDAIGRRLVQKRPDMVIVQGDTSSALAGALAARDVGIPLAHVEAGLRSHNLEPWPEEDNRVTIDSLADLLFAPTELAASNLAREPQVRGAIHVTGNSGVDALLQAIRPVSRPASSERKRIIVTAHRRENQVKQLRDICGALKRLVYELPVEIVFLLHSNPQHRLLIENELSGVEHIHIREQVDHPDMVELMIGSWAFLTDSGGLQEDGPTLGRPVLVLREVTERVEAPHNIELVGTDPDAIFGAVNHLLMSRTCYARMATPAMPFGDGQAAPRIAAAIADWLVGGSRRAEAS